MAIEIRICISENSFQDVNDIVVKRVGFASDATFNKAQPLKVRQRANLRQRFASARPMMLDCEAHYLSSWKDTLSFLEDIGSVPKTLFNQAKKSKVSICKRLDLMTETAGKVNANGARSRQVTEGYQALWPAFDIFNPVRARHLLPVHCRHIN